MFHRLLICTDFSDGLHRLVKFVSSFEAAGVKHITFFHSVPFLEERNVPKEDIARLERARNQLSIALTEVPSGMTVQVRVESGRAIDLILRATQEVQADLIMLGTPPRSLLTEKLLGSTSVEVVRRASVPIMSLRPQLISTFTSEELDLRCRHLFHYLLLPYDGSEAAKFLVQQMKQFAPHQKPDSALQRLHLCWIVEGLRRQQVPPQYQIEAAQKELTTVQAELAALGLQVDPIEVRQGEPLAEVLEVANLYDIGAIVGTSDNNQLMQLSAPSFNSELMRRSWHPLIYFPYQR